MVNKKGSTLLQIVTGLIIVLLIVALVYLVFIRQIHSSGKSVKDLANTCSIDSDADGVVDCTDACPDNPEKIEPPCDNNANTGP